MGDLGEAAGDAHAGAEGGVKPIGEADVDAAGVVLDSESLVADGGVERARGDGDVALDGGLAVSGLGARLGDGDGLGILGRGVGVRVVGAAAGERHGGEGKHGGEDE